MTQPVGPRLSTNRMSDEDRDASASVDPLSSLNCSNIADHPPPIPESLARVASFSAAERSSPARRIQASLDRFMASMEGPYQTPDGPQWVSPPFRMRRAPPSQPEIAPNHAPLVDLARKKAGMSPGDVQAIQSGRGTPEQIRRLTQAIIDVSGHPPRGGPWNPLDIRALMFACGIGIDCASYTQQAYLSMRGQTRAQAGFGALGNENLSNLEQRGFTRVQSVEDVRAGDIMALGSPSPGDVGHRCIVYENRLATPDELRELCDTGQRAHDFSLTSPIYVMQLDSSWGSNGRFDVGGVERQTFFYSGSTHQWARYAPPLFGDVAGKPQFVTTDGPYDHPLEGFYRSPAAPGPQP